MASTEKPDLANYKSRMDKAVAALKEEFASLRTGRASAGLLDQVMVEAYGNTVPLNQVGSVSVPEPRSISVSIWDRALVIAAEKAIRNAGLGFNPVTEGQNLRIPVPPLTEERRKEMVKLVKGEAEDAKIAIRNIRRDANEQVKKLVKDKLASEDEERRSNDEIQKLTDKFVIDVDKLVAEKEKEVLTV